MNKDSKPCTKIIAVVGMAGSGKSESCLYFASRGIPILRFGDQTDIGLKELGLERNEKNERQYRENLRKELGMAAYAVKIKPRIVEVIRRQKPKLVVLDGLYSWEEYIFLKQSFPELLLLAIYARPKIRHQRLNARKVRPLTFRQAKERDMAEIINSNKGGPIAFCDDLIVNESNRRDLNQKLARVVDSL